MDDILKTPLVQGLMIKSTESKWCIIQAFKLASGNLVSKIVTHHTATGYMLTTLTWLERVGYDRIAWLREDQLEPMKEQLADMSKKFYGTNFVFFNPFTKEIR